MSSPATIRCRPSVRSLGVLVLFGVGGCARGVAPSPTPAAVPPPVVAPAAPPAPVAVRYAVPAVVTDTRYRLQSVTELERDSAGRRETQRLSSQAEVVVRLRRRPSGAFEASGRVFGYAVTSALSTTPIAIDSLRFDAVLDSLALRVALRPPLANECDRPESGALTMVRDLLPRVPASLSIGDRWSDSTVLLVCRSSLPMVVRTHADYVVTDTVRDADGVYLVIRRASRTRVEGKTSSPWRSVEVAGTGSATLETRVSVLTGAVGRVQGSSTLMLTVTDHTSPPSTRTQQVTQRVTLTGERIGN